MPSRTSVDEILRGRATLNELAEQAGRGPKSIEVMAFGQDGHFRDRESIKELEEGGIDRVTIWLSNTEADPTTALREMDDIARRVLV